MLKHGNNTEIMETWFSIKCQSRKYFLQELKYFLASDFRVQFEKRFRKGC